MKELFKKIIFLNLVIFVMLYFSEMARAEEECQCFPHNTEQNGGTPLWRLVEEHGVFTLNRFRNGLDPTIGDTCRECHGSSLTGGTSGVSCSSCHVTHFQIANWQAPTVHGVYAVAHGWEANCKNACHGDENYGGNYLGGLSEVSCYSCHPPFPHTAQWADETQTTSENYHGNYVINNDAIQERMCQGACHGVDYSGGLSGKACAECHEAYPHIKNWSRPDTHGIYAAAFGVDETCGVGCHGENYEGGNTGISCYNCHENFPHSANYTTGHESMSGEDAYQCASLCHGGDLSGGLSGVSCVDCHTNSQWPLYNLMQEFFFLNDFGL